MINSAQIKNLAAGKQPKQYVTVTVESKGDIIPAVILNVYLNLEMEFIHMAAAARPGKPYAISLRDQASTVMVNIFFFKTRRANFENHFGPYHPGKVLQFDTGAK